MLDCLAGSMVFDHVRLQSGLSALVLAEQYVAVGTGASGLCMPEDAPAAIVCVRRDHERVPDGCIVSLLTSQSYQDLGPEPTG